MFDVEIELHWFVIGESIIALHPASNALTTLLLLRPYRRAFRRMLPFSLKRRVRRYDSIRSPANTATKKGGGSGADADESAESHSNSQNRDESSNGVIAVTVCKGNKLIKSRACTAALNVACNWSLRHLCAFHESLRRPKCALDRLDKLDAIVFMRRINKDCLSPFPSIQ